jgi:hypothetical protein
MSEAKDQFPFLSDREAEVLTEIATRRDTSINAVMRQALRVYQLVDHYQREGMTLGFLDDQGDFFDPFDQGPKMAPTPYCGGVNCKQLKPGMTFHDEKCPEREGNR